MPEKLDRIRRIIKKNGLDAILVNGSANIQYLSGYPGSELCVLLMAKGRGFFLTDPRAYEEARTSIKNLTPVCVKSLYSMPFRDVLEKNGVKKLGFESGHVTYNMFERLGCLLRKTRLLPTFEIVENQRAIKSKDEISLIKNASSLTVRMFQAIKRRAFPGMSEKDLVREIAIMISKKGGTNAFEPIVAAGEHSAVPHASASKRKIKKGEHVLIDFGIRLRGYNSDFTRPVFTGTVKKIIKKMYGVIKKAQEQAINLVHPGARISSIAKKVNSAIEKAGFGKFILHGLGHGIGIEVHELPRLSAHNETLLKAGMVFTVEPGIYIPGIGGVRVEDVVCVTNDGKMVLTR